MKSDKQKLFGEKGKKTENELIIHEANEKTKKIVNLRGSTVINKTKEERKSNRGKENVMRMKVDAFEKIIFSVDFIAL